MECTPALAGAASSGEAAVYPRSGEFPDRDGIEIRKREIIKPACELVVSSVLPRRKAVP